MRDYRTPRRSIFSRLGIPDAFFQFDMKDTFRLVVWIVMTAFGLGGLWAKNKTDMAELRGADSVAIERVAREERARQELAQQVAKVSEDMSRRTALEAAQVQALEGIRTELRYVNDKIDVLRTDVRASRRPE